MRISTLFLVMMALLLTCQPVFGQEEKAEPEAKDNSGLVLQSGSFGPFLEFVYGTSSPGYKGFDQSFAKLGLAEVKIGYSSEDSLKYNLVALDQHYGFVSFLNSDLSSSGEAGADEIGSEMTRFGFGNRMAYGYGGSGLNLDLYNQNGLDWTKLTPKSYDTLDEEAQALFDRFGTTYRFGQLTEAGIRVHLSGSLSLTAGAEGAVILPRTVFWPWLGSVAIYSTVQGGLEIYSAKIIEASPKIGPVIAFLLKTGVSAGYYYLLREDMNWPFGYEAPVTVESFKLGVNLTF